MRGDQRLDRQPGPFRVHRMHRPRRTKGSPGPDGPARHFPCAPLLYGEAGRFLLSGFHWVTLACMPGYLRCSVTGEPVGPCYLDEDHAHQALGSSELLFVDSWMADKASFPRPRGLRREVVRDLAWEVYIGNDLRALVREFRQAVGSQPLRPAEDVKHHTQRQGGADEGDP